MAADVPAGDHVLLAAELPRVGGEAALLPGLHGPGIHVVATARLKAGGPDRPVAFTQTYGKGRIFQTLLGADAAAIGIPGATQLIRYGSLWAAEK